MKSILVGITISILTVIFSLLIEDLTLISTLSGYITLGFISLSILLLASSINEDRFKTEINKEKSSGDKRKVLARKAFLISLPSLFLIILLSF
jgi:heme O synthase-like polyprenyltransferase